MGQELALPSWARQQVAPAFQVLNPNDDSLSEGIGQSYPVIGYKGKVWSFRWRGERKTFIRPDDGTPASYLDVIILGQAKQKSKSFYKKFDPNQSDGDRPICSSIDGVTPDPDVTTKQADACALCPRNVWKADPQTGRKGRECTDYKRIAVLVLPAQTKALYGQPVLEPAFLRIPPASLNSLAIMGDTMAGQGFHYSAYITRITFDPNEAHPKMIFAPLQPLTNDEAPVILQMREDVQVDRIVTGGYAERGVQTVPPQNNTVLVPPQQPVVQQPAVPNAQPAMLDLQANAPSTVGPAPLQPIVSPQETGLQTSVSAPPATNVGQGLVDTGLSSVAPVNTTPTNSGGATLAPTQPALAPSQQATGDAGAPEATDDDLDARIASMMGTK